ncbi:MAG: hypothetical protein HEP71_31575 [Roseivirga sp.]|nr:hypothetical protein [Roseivirga sp.]
MATDKFKEGITERFKMLVGLLIRSGLAKNNTEVGVLMNQPPQAISKMLMGERIITLEQIATLSRNTNINSNWLLKGVGPIFIEEGIDEGDIITVITRAITDGRIPTQEGEQMIAELVKLRNLLQEKQEEINGLQGKMMDLMESQKKL